MFDETYYVGAARSILHSGVDPNLEHPSLAKLAIAGSMRLLGDNPLGWRFMSLVFGTASILLMYWLVRVANGSQWLALGTAALMAADNLFLVQGRIAMLDIFVVPFMLAGVALYVRDHPLMGGVIIGVGACAKLVGIYALLVVLIFEAMRIIARWAANDQRRRHDIERRLRGVATCSAATVVSLLALLYVLDVGVTRFTNPFDHIRYMYGYGNNDTRFPGIPGVKFAPASSAWRWLVNRVPDVYFRSYESVGVHPGRTLIFFQGRMNPFIIYMAVPALLLAGGAAWKRRDTVSFVIVAWFTGTYLPFVAISFQHHASYLFYMLVVLPAVFVGVARLFSRRYVPTMVAVCYSVLVIYGLFTLYPIRALTL